MNVGSLSKPNPQGQHKGDLIDSMPKSCKHGGQEILWCAHRSFLQDNLSSHLGSKNTTDSLIPGVPRTGKILESLFVSLGRNSATSH